jgi:GNAT superfamily N-acetyltransferase
MEICRYGPEHADAVFGAIAADAAWVTFTRLEARDRYRQRLADSVTYVCHDRGGFAGFLRALHDDGFAVYVSELYVVPSARGRGIGRALIARLTADYGHLAIYVLSDEDAYYEKLGYRRVGSVFEIPRTA